MDKNDLNFFGPLVLTFFWVAGWSFLSFRVMHYEEKLYDKMNLLNNPAYKPEKSRPNGFFGLYITIMFGPILTILMVYSAFKVFLRLKKLQKEKDTKR